MLLLFHLPMFIYVEDPVRAIYPQSLKYPLILVKPNYYILIIDGHSSLNTQINRLLKFQALPSEKYLFK